MYVNSGEDMNILSDCYAEKLYSILPVFPIGVFISIKTSDILNLFQISILQGEKAEKA